MLPGLETVMITEAMVEPVLPEGEGLTPLNQGGRASMPSLEVR